MTEELAEDSRPIVEVGIGQRLRISREAQGFTLEQVVAQTRIPQRHLLKIEAGDFAGLAGRTYAVGFAKTYAKMLGMDAEAVAREVRHVLDAHQQAEPAHPAPFEPGDPARVPSISLGWISAAAVLVLIVAGFFLLPRLFAPAAQLPSLIDQQAQEQAVATAAAKAAAAGAAQVGIVAAPGGAVVFTALEDGIWVKFYDAGGRQLMQKLMAKGETYAVPADAEGPQLWTGRPEALAITVGGKPVPPLAQAQRTMRDVSVTAAALLARPQPTPAVAALPAATATQ